MLGFVNVQGWNVENGEDLCGEWNEREFKVVRVSKTQLWHRRMEQVVASKF